MLQSMYSTDENGDGQNILPAQRNKLSNTTKKDVSFHSDKQLTNTSSRDAAWLLRDKYAGVENESYRADLARLATGEPLAYVIGWIPFLGLRIELGSRPLIPRPETEWWTEKLIQTLHKKYGTQQFHVLDLCAGSGAIGTAILAEFSNAYVTFIDIDSAYEKTIKDSLALNNISKKRAQFHTGDLFAPIQNEQFDIVVTNPPYIPENRILPTSVEDFEPAPALRAGAHGLDIIRRIAQDIQTHLTPNGFVWIEIDALHAKESRTLFANSGMHTTLYKDPYGRERLIVAY